MTTFDRCNSCSRHSIVGLQIIIPNSGVGSFHRRSSMSVTSDTVVVILVFVLFIGMLHDHSGSVYAHVPQHERREFVPMPEKDHRVQHETPDDRQGQVDEPMCWKGRLIDMKEQKQQEEKVWKVLQALAAPKANERKALNGPYDAGDGKGQKLVAVVKLDQKEHHSKHDWDKY